MEYWAWDKVQDKCCSLHSEIFCVLISVKKSNNFIDHKTIQFTVKCYFIFLHLWKIMENCTKYFTVYGKEQSFSLKNKTMKSSFPSRLLLPSLNPSTVFSHWAFHFSSCNKAANSLRLPVKLSLECWTNWFSSIITSPAK